MIFQTESAINKILNGEKTQTRRIVKPGHREHFSYWSDGTHKQIAEIYECRDDRLIYCVGRTYAVQPGRGKQALWWYQHPTMGPLVWSDNAPQSLAGTKHPLRIRILAIRREDVRNISNEDVRAEGYPHARDFLHAWCAMHDPSIERGTWGETKLMARPTERYDAWVLTFEMVK